MIHTTENQLQWTSFGSDYQVDASKNRREISPTPKANKRMLRLVFNGLNRRFFQLRLSKFIWIAMYSHKYTLEAALSFLLHYIFSPSHSYKTVLASF